MKNIHVLSTDKPSRLIKSKINDTIVLEPINVTNNTRYWEYLNIYITSDEQIKEGDWFLPKGHINPHKLKGFNKISGDLESYNGLCYDISKCKKIILTTDQDLINDGVQAIDDKFLEWFVKNPSCEEVGIEPLMAGFVDDEPSYYENMYDIIIPKEEPKQETLEEASETAWNLYEHVEGNLYSTSFKNGFKLGAEWLQDKKMYSEEDMKSFGDWCRNALLNTEYSFEKLDEHLKTWEQIRNK
jgi:hypothetical protein